jgi:hypothetical protein
MLKIKNKLGYKNSETGQFFPLNPIYLQLEINIKNKR